MEKEPTLLPFREIRLSVPRETILIYLNKPDLTIKESRKLRRVLYRLEAVSNKLNHLKSIIEKCLLKSY